MGARDCGIRPSAEPRSGRLETDIQAGQPVAIVLVDRGGFDEHSVVGGFTPIRQSAPFLDERDEVAANVVAGVFITQTADDPQCGAVPSTQKITSHDVFADGIVRHR